MELNDADLKSPLWLKLSAHFEERLRELRVENDKRKGDIDTAYLRGKIAEVKRVMDLAQPAPRIETEE